jgi:hypothetical protein
MKHAMLFFLAIVAGSQVQASATISGPLADRIYEIMAYTAELEDEDETTIEQYRKVYEKQDASGNVVALVIGNANTNATGESFECTAPSETASSTCASSHETFPAASGGLSASLFRVLDWGFQVEETVTGVNPRIGRIDQGYAIGAGSVTLNCRSFRGPGLAEVQVEQCKIVRALNR